MAKFEHDEQKRILARVQKCLNLGNDAGATEGERDNAMRMAHAILAKYNLSLAEVGAHGDAQERKEADGAEPRIDHSATFGAWPWALQVCMSVADLFFCTYLVSKGKSVHFGHHYFIGRQSNATTAALVAEFVVKSIYSEACKRMRKEGKGWPFIRAFCYGAMLSVRARVQQLKEDPVQVANGTTSSAPGTALVLANHYASEAEANRKYIVERWGGTVAGKRSRVKGFTEQGALQQGQAYGQSVSLNAQIK
jgi:hypothetical protein